VVGYQKAGVKRVEMSIRIRRINGELVALCAAKSKSRKDDIYLGDEEHHALYEKFYSDFKSEGLIVESKAGIYARFLGMLRGMTKKQKQIVLVALKSYIEISQE